jgi:hypothetical protein
MNKVSDVYTPEVSRHKLSVRFGDNLPVIEVIRHMNNSNLCVFAALCDGHTVTTTGYDIPADFWVNRASAVACSLKQLYLPIETQTIQTKADVGGTTKQSVFYMSDISIQRLETEPEKIMSECEKLQGVQKKSCAQKDMARLYKSFGEEGVLELLRNACSANDAPPSGEQKAG